MEEDEQNPNEIKNQNYSDTPLAIKDRYTQINYTDFTSKRLIFDGFPSINNQDFVQEVIVQIKKNNDGSRSLKNPLSLQDARFVENSIKNHFTQESPVSLFRTPIHFYISFKYAIDVCRPLDEILQKLMELTEDIKILREWTRRKKVKILDSSKDSGILDFLVTDVVFKEACERFSWSISGNEIVKLDETSLPYQV